MRHHDRTADENSSVSRKNARFLPCFSPTGLVLMIPFREEKADFHLPLYFWQCFRRGESQTRLESKMVQYDSVKNNLE